MGTAEIGSQAGENSGLIYSIERSNFGFCRYGCIDRSAK
jgi:hypothetical protein